MRLVSKVFQNNGPIPAKYTCDGENVNPPLLISDVPEEAKSLVLIVDDPDAPNGVWTHWLVWNINTGLHEIKENEIPDEGVEGTTSFNKVGYGAPCPPHGSHRYFFKLYALNEFLALKPGAHKKDLENAMRGKVLDYAELIGVYKRL